MFSKMILKTMTQCDKIQSIENHSQNTPLKFSAVWPCKREYKWEKNGRKEELCLQKFCRIF